MVYAKSQMKHILIISLFFLKSHAKIFIINISSRVFIIFQRIFLSLRKLCVGSDSYWTTTSLQVGFLNQYLQPVEISINRIKNKYIFKHVDCTIFVDNGCTTNIHKTLTNNPKSDKMLKHPYRPKQNHTNQPIRCCILIPLCLHFHVIHQITLN